MEMPAETEQVAPVVDDVDCPLSFVKQEPLIESGQDQPVLHNNSHLDAPITQIEQEPIDRYDTIHLERYQESTDAPVSPKQISYRAYFMNYQTGENRPGYGQRSTHPMNQLELAVPDEKVTSHIHTAEEDNVHQQGGINLKETCDQSVQNTCNGSNSLFPVAIFKHQTTSEENVKTEEPAYAVRHTGIITRKAKKKGRPKPHMCSLCDFRTAYKYNLISHMQRHTGEKPYSCSMCDYKSARKHHVVEHMRTHTGERPYICPHCDFRSAGQRNLSNHLRTHTGEKPHKCPECDFRTAHTNNLVAHMRKHTGEQPFICALCGYRSSWENAYITHMASHSEEKPYMCSVCEFRSAHRAAIVTHMKRHSGVKPYACSVCDYTSIGKNELIIHIRKHTGEKPYKCSECDYSAADKKCLVYHMRKHTGEKPYICSQCDFRSAHRDGLVNHIRKHPGAKPKCIKKSTRTKAKEHEEITPEEGHCTQSVVMDCQ